MAEVMKAFTGTAALLLGLAMLTGCDPVESCQTLRGCPQEAPNAQHVTENAPEQGQEPHPQADPGPAKKSNNVETPVVFTCTWFARLWIEFTPAVNGEPRATKEKRFADSNGGSHSETIGVEPGSSVALDCKLLAPDEGPEYPKTLHCTLVVFGKVIQGGGYRQSNSGKVHCYGTV